MHLIRLNRILSKLLKIFSLLLALFIIIFLYNKSKVLSTNAIYENIPKPDDNLKKTTPYEITLENTIFQGRNKNLIPYTINAKKAVKISEDIYNLEQINGQYHLKNKNVIISGDIGHINNLTHYLHLKGNIKGLFNEATLTTDTLQINLLTQEILSNSKVHINFKNSVINADSFTIKDENIISLEGNVTTKFNISDF